MNTKLWFMLAAVVLLTIAGCETQNVGALGSPERGTSQFSLNVWSESYLDASSADSFTLAAEDQGDSVLVDVNVSGAQELKALYFDLSYDPQLYRPMVVEPTKAMGDKGNLLQMSRFNERGKLYHGQVIANYQWRAGLTGDATVAQVLFLKQPAVNSRSSSAAPDAPTSATTLAFDSGTGTLSWMYFNTGDYDQNGEVNIADLTPLGANFGESVAPADFPIASALSAIDGDFNGQLNIADLTPIGANFGASAVGGYNIYESLDAADAPDTATGPNGAGATLVTNVAFNTATGGLPDSRKAFEHVLAAPTPNAYYWVRPTDGTNDGIASNLVGGNPALAPVLALTNPPAGGDGTAGNPYIADVTTDYTFTLTDPTDGDVTVTGDFNVSDGAAGVLTEGVNPVTFNFDDAFEGTINITATYNSTPSNPSAIYLRIEGTPPPGGLEIYPDPADTDWPAISPIDIPTGHDNPYYVLSDSGFNTDFLTEFSLLADDDPATPGVSGNPVPVGDLTWVAFPAPFLVEWVADGTFRVNQFTNAYIIAQDTTPQDSNKIYVETHALP